MTQKNLETAFRDTWKFITDEENDKDRSKGVNKFILINLFDLFLLKRHPKAYKYYLRFVRPIILRRLSNQREQAGSARTYITYREQAGCSSLPDELFSKNNLENGKEELLVSKVEKLIATEVPSALTPFQKFVKPHIVFNQHPHLKYTARYENTNETYNSTRTNRSESSGHNTKRSSSAIEPTNNQNFHSSFGEDVSNQRRSTKKESVSLVNPKKIEQQSRMPHKHNTSNSRKREENRSRESLGRHNKRSDERQKKAAQRGGDHTKKESKDGSNSKSKRSMEQGKPSGRNSRAEDTGLSRSKKDSHSIDHRKEKGEEQKKQKPPPGYPSAPPGFPTLPAGYPHFGSSSSPGNGNSTPAMNNQSPPPGYPGVSSSQSTPGFSCNANNQPHHGMTSTELVTPCPSCLVGGPPLLNGKVSKVVGKIKEKINDPEFQQQAQVIQRKARKFITKQAKKVLENK